MLLLHNAGQFLGMSPPPPAGRRCGQTSPATAGTGNRFPSGQSRPVSDCLCPACRYNNKPWGDCDPLLLLRTKHVTLVKDSRYRWVVQTSDSTNNNSHLSSHEDCLETREFSQTCTSEDLTSGIQRSDNYRLQQYSLLFKEAGS